MRAPAVICFFFGLLSVGCATHVEHIPAYGAVWALSHDDIRAAIAAWHKVPDVHSGSIDYIDVAGRNTITIVYNATKEPLPVYYDLQRDGGVWRCRPGYMILDAF